MDGIGGEKAPVSAGRGLTAWKLRHDEMTSIRKVRITCYRFAGRFLFFKIRKRCEECNLTHIVLQKLMSEVFQDNPVTLENKPWLDHWWKIIWRGAWHAPIVLVNGRVFSQGIVPDAAGLISHIGSLLEDPALAARSRLYGKKKAPAEEPADVLVYFSPACPHCKKLVTYLDANNVRYTRRDVTQIPSARKEIEKLTGRLAIPVLKVRDSFAVGFDRDKVNTLLGLTPSKEKEETILKASTEERIPKISRDLLGRTFENAKKVLEENRQDGKTQASKNLYPHQWNWDSGFIARGYLRFDPDLAYKELQSLFRGQWEDGFLPHIIFNPSFLDHFPGPRYWKVDRSGRVPPGVHTSGISQPAIHASMLADALELDPDRERARAFLKEIYPKLKGLHDFFFRHRDPLSEGLVCLVHPWESGLDNTPIWDESLSNIRHSSPWAREMQKRYNDLAERGNRPKRSYIEKYSYLVESLFKKNYTWEAILSEHPFQIQDVLFNSILCKAEQDLGKIAEAIGKDSKPHSKRAARMAAAMNRKLWDETKGLYYSFDLVAGKRIERDTVFSYLPLYAEICDANRAKRLTDNLRSHCFCVAEKDCMGIPSYDMCQIDYDGEYYWRGPVWFNMCWYMGKGVRNCGETELAEWLENSMLELVSKNGFYEYYEPETGKGLGAEGFSWTAALFIDLAAERIQNEGERTE